MNKQVRQDVLRILDCYQQDLRYHDDLTGLEGVNGMTYGTPEFESEDELTAYFEWLTDTIGQFIEETRA